MKISHNDLETVLSLFNMVYQIKFEPRETKKSYYCGITNDLERRKVEHDISNYAITVECDSFEVAKELEQMLHNDGFDTGRQVGNGEEDSVFVYMYRK